LLIIACNDKKASIDKSTINELSKGDFKIPSRYGYLLLFINSGDSIGCTNVNVLHGIYMHNYSTSYRAFEAFLSDALNQKISFHYDMLKNSNVKVFPVNTTTKSEYEQSNLSDFLKLYCIKKGENRFIVKKQYQNTDQLFTILYYFFINNYKVNQDDYIGEFIVSK
jgi:hypothetical protein